MNMTRTCYLVTTAFKAHPIKENVRCQYFDDAAPPETNVDQDKFVWAYEPEGDWIRFSLSRADLCVRKEVFTDCTRRYVAPEEGRDEK